MKLSFILTAFCLGFSVLPNNNVYTFQVEKITSGTVSLSEMTGKRILVITLPLDSNHQSANRLLFELDSLAAAHQQQLQVIAVPAIEDGFQISQSSALNTWYRSVLHDRIVIATGLHTRKISGANQHPLFKWLTSESENLHFDKDVTGPGCKFFSNSSGDLVAVLNPQTELNSGVINRVLQIQ